MHVNNGHTNHFIRAMLKKVRGWRDENCDWQRYVANFKRDLNEWREEMEDSRPLANSDLELKRNMTTLRGRVTRTRTRLTRLDNIDFPVAREIELIERAREELKIWKEELEEVKEKRRETARSSKGGMWHLIMCGVDHLEETVEESMEEGCALPRKDVECALADFPESWAKGGYDRRRTGGDMTNGKAMNAMQNFGEVTRGLKGMHDPGAEEHEWCQCS